MNLSHLGTLLPNGDIHLFDRNIKRRADMKGNPRRIRQSAKIRNFLGRQGFQPTKPSSNVSALRVDGDDLYIRFLNGSVYKYPGSADLFDAIMQGVRGSVGGAVWKYLRWAKKPYQKVGTLNFKDEPELGITDEEMFQKMDAQPILDMVKNASKAIIKNETIIVNGIESLILLIDGLRVYIPLALIVQNGRL